MKRIILALIIIVALAGNKVSAQGCGGDAPDEGMKIFGFLQSQYEYHMTDPSSNSFTFERARIGAMGKIPYDFSYYVVLEMSPFISANPYLLDAFITYDRFDWARLSVGSFKIPFGLETNTACNNLTTVYRSKATLQMVAPFRDIGMVLMGGNDQTIFTYQLGLMNGSGLKIEDNNTKKDIVARVTAKPFKYLRIGGSFRYGYPNSESKPESRTTFGFEISAKYEGFRLDAEYINDEGAFNDELGGGCSGDLMKLGAKRSGGYATLSYLTKWNVEPVFRFDYFNSGNDVDYKENNMTFGINYFFNDWTRLQANYIYKSEDGIVPQEKKNDEFVIQLQVKF